MYGKQLFKTIRTKRYRICCWNTFWEIKYNWIRDEARCELEASHRSFPGLNYAVMGPTRVHSLIWFIYLKQFFGSLLRMSVKCVESLLSPIGKNSFCRSMPFYAFSKTSYWNPLTVSKWSFFVDRELDILQETGWKFPIIWTICDNLLEIDWLLFCPTTQLKKSIQSLRMKPEYRIIENSCVRVISILWTYYHVPQLKSDGSVWKNTNFLHLYLDSWYIIDSEPIVTNLTPDLGMI